MLKTDKPSSGRFGNRSHTHGMLVQGALETEGDMPVHQGEQGVVLTHADIGAGMESGATLAHDDRTFL